MKRYDLAFPVRTRGGLTSPAAPPTTRGAVRTRGAVQVAGGLAAAPPPAHLALAMTFGDLLARLRNQVEDVPLVAVIFGWPSPAAHRFADELQRLFGADDRVWRVGLPGEIPSDDDPPLGVLLDLSSDLDARILRNQPAEVVFLSGDARAHDQESAYLDGVSGVSTLVVAEYSPGGSAAIAVARFPGSQQVIAEAGAAGTTTAWICSCPSSLLLK